MFENREKKIRKKRENDLREQQKMSIKLQTNLKVVSNCLLV